MDIFMPVTNLTTQVQWRIQKLETRLWAEKLKGVDVTDKRLIMTV
jgi:hypothetical protein